MLISFVVYVTQDFNKFLNTIKSLEAQTNDDFEIIALDDWGLGNNSNVLDQIIEHQQKMPGKFKILFNTRNQGYAYGINVVNAYAKGKYIIYTNDDQVFSPDFVENINRSVGEAKNSPDIIEFNISFSDTTETLGLKVSPEITGLQTIASTPAIFALIVPTICNKLFKLSIIKKQNIKMRDYAWYKTLFLYQVLSNSKIYLGLDYSASASALNDLRYSIFDLIKQWVHIFNYFREQDQYKNLQQELDYAYAHYLLIDFPNLVLHACENKLRIKALTSAQNKLLRHSRYLSKNKYIINSNDASLKKIVNNTNGHYKKLRSIEK